MKIFKVYLSYVSSMIVALVFFPLSTFAHEVYVLDSNTIAQDVAVHSPNPFTEIIPHLSQFILWGLVFMLTVAIVFYISINPTVQKVFNPFLAKLKPLAPLIARVTLGLSLFSCAYYDALFGTELPLHHFFGNYDLLFRSVLYVIGVGIILGIFTRLFTFLALFIFGWGVMIESSYMLTYVNYLGEILVTLILGGGNFSIDRLLSKGNGILNRMIEKVEPYSFLILRVLFGFSLIYASAYAKILHSNLALDTVIKYHLTSYFHFDPLFLVLGAGMTECLIGIFIIFGFEIRFISVFFLTFLTLSLNFFGESVWPHFILIGVGIALICHGYDRYTIGFLLKKAYSKRQAEPVL